MKMRRLSGIVLGLFLMSAVCFFVACSDGGNNTENNNNNNNTGFTCTEQGVCTLKGTYTKSLKLTADKKWLLSGGVFIGDDEKETILTIEAGTVIYGETATIPGALVIRRGSKIMAEGTREKPIIFTSSKAPGKRARGDWGGLVINGRARINACSAGKTPCQALGEGAGTDGTGWYGGEKDDDNSGVLKYVRVEFAGRTFGPDNELNGIAFQGVGSGTTVEHIQIHMSKDDGIEFFGGMVSFKYVLLTGIGDDNLDWTEGWRGKGQFVIAQQYQDNGDNGIEADNNGKNNSATPRSKPTLSNLTLIGSPESSKSDLGILLREGTAANISNVILLGFNEACLALDHEETLKNASSDGKTLTGELTLSNSILSCKTPFKAPEKPAQPSFSTEDFFKVMNVGNHMLDPMLEAPFSLDRPNFMPKSGSPALKDAKIPEDAFFTKVEFIGAMGKEDWTQGWTTVAPN